MLFGDLRFGAMRYGHRAESNGEVIQMNSPSLASVRSQARRRLISLILSCALLAPCLPISFSGNASAYGFNPQGVQSPPGLPDLDVARLLPPVDVQPPVPIPSTLPLCLPYDPLCGGYIAYPTAGPKDPPTVTITSPKNGASFTAPATITINASATVTNGSIVKVQFFKDGTLLGEDTTPPYSFTWGPVFAGTYSLTAKATDSAGEIGTSSNAVNVTVSSAAGGSGLRGEYFSNMNLSGAPALTRTDPSIDLSWGAGSPSPSIPNDQFSVRWSGQVQAEFTENYTFHVFSDDGVIVWVNGQKIIDRWFDQFGPEVASTPVFLQAGQKYDIKILYYENCCGAEIHLKWSSASTPKQVIPTSRLFPTTSLPNQLPVANAGGPYTGTVGAAVTFNGSGSSDPDGLIVGYQWNFGDGTPFGSGATPAHAYQAAGTYTVTLTVTDDNGAQRSISTNATISGPPPPPGDNFAVARTDQSNRTGQPGEDLFSRNFNWSLPLVGLAGRAGLDLGLSLTYNSLVWTRDGNSIKFNADNGFPGPGFRLGFPVIQQRYFNPQVGANAYLMITPSGSRVELRQVGTSSIYESGDSSYLQMTDGANPVVRAADGTQLTYTLYGNEYRCTQIKDRNGNYIIAAYDGGGRIATITDTLGRVVAFNYDLNQNLLSITQIWNGATHTWATFGYSTQTIQTNFPGLTVVGPANYSGPKNQDQKMES